MKIGNRKFIVTALSIGAVVALALLHAAEESFYALTGIAAAFMGSNGMEWFGRGRGGGAQ